MSTNTTDLDLLDEEEELNTFDDPGRQPSGEGQATDEPATGDEPEGRTTPEGEGTAKDGETDWELKATELEVELETLRTEVPDLQKAREFLDDAAKAADPDALMAVIAKHVGVELPQSGAPATALTGGGWDKVSALLEQADEDGNTFDDSTKAVVGAIKSAVEATVAPILARLAKIEPHVTEAQKSKESAERESEAERRAGGIAKLVISMSAGRNHGWQPTKEQVVAVAKKHPDVFVSGAKDAKSLATALLEKVRAHHLDDIIGHTKKGQQRPEGDKPVPAPKNDARGSDNAHEARKASIKARMRSGV